MIRLTAEQQAAVDHRSNLQLPACPGSGKTRVILAKLLALAEEVIGSPQSIGCITYTNAAVDEIESRLRIYGGDAAAQKCEISTIHSFCLHFILRPYSWLIPEIPLAFKVITRQMAEFEEIIRTVEDAFGRQVRSRTYDEYESLRIEKDGTPAGSGFTSGIVTEASARHYWKTVRERGFLDFSMILYYACRIVVEFEFVSRGIAARFKWLLIDEFQDTTEIQLSIFASLHNHLHTNFFMVGDDNQSIMGFAGATPGKAIEFAHIVGADKTLSLTGNFRSAPSIVAMGEAIIASTPGMKSAGKAQLLKGKIEYVHVDQPLEAVTDYFLPLLRSENIPLGNAAVLAPWWTHLLPIARALREYDVPVFGPGARPYNKRRLIAGLAEQLGACAESDHYLGIPGVERAIYRLVSDMTGSTRLDVFTYVGRRTALGLIYLAKDIAEQQPGGVAWLRALAREAGLFLYRDEWLPMSAVISLQKSAEEMISDMQIRGVDLANLLIADMGLFANPDQAIKLMTLHNSKGREFEAVAMICMNRGHIPHFSARTDAEYEEARRLFYVGATRAKQILVVASDRVDRRNPPCPFIADAGFDRLGR